MNNKEQWVEYLEGELPLEEYELRGALLRHSQKDREDVTQLESLRQALKEADPVSDFDDYLNSKDVQTGLHERIMQGVLDQPPKEKKSAKELLKLYSGLGKTLMFRKPVKRI